MKKRLVSLLMSSVMVVVALAGCGNQSTGGSTEVTVTDAEGNETTVNVADTATGQVNEETGTYEVSDLYIVVDGTVTATVDSGQDAFVEQWEAAVGEKLGHPAHLHINQLDHSDYAGTVSRLLTTGTVGDGSFPDALIMSATMFRSYQTSGLLWNMAEAYDNAEFQSRVTLPAVNLGMRTPSGEQYGFAPTYGNGCVTYVKASWFNEYAEQADGINTIEDVDTYDKYIDMLTYFSQEKTYGVVAAGFGKLDEAPYINYMPEFWQGAYPAIYQKDGVWVDGFQEQATADALDRLAAAYAAGLIDPDTEGFSTKKAREKFFSNDQSTSEGVFAYWAGTWLRTLTNNMEKNDVDNDLGDERLLQLPPIKEIEDTWGGYLNREAPVWVITDDGDDNSLREQAIFDALFETMLDGDTVQTLWTYGAEDVHWSQSTSEMVRYDFGKASQNIQEYTADGVITYKAICDTVVDEEGKETQVPQDKDGSLASVNGSYDMSLYEVVTDDDGNPKVVPYSDGVSFHLLPTLNDPSATWKKNHLDAVLVIAPLTNGYADEDALVTLGNEFFTTHCVDAPTAPSSETLTAINSDLASRKQELMNKVVTGEMSSADAIAEYQEEYADQIEEILAELNSQTE